MTDDIQQRVQIAEPWTAELELRNGSLIVNLINAATGEIRQRHFSADTVARRLFASTIRTSKKHPDRWSAIRVEKKDA